MARHAPLDELEGEAEAVGAACPRGRAGGRSGGGSRGRALGKSWRAKRRRLELGEVKATRPFPDPGAWSVWVVQACPRTLTQEDRP